MTNPTIISIKPNDNGKTDKYNNPYYFLTVQDDEKQTYTFSQSFKNPPQPGLFDGTLEEGTWPDGNPKYSLKRTPKPFGGQGGGYKTDPNSFFLSYAKDIAVACVEQGILKDSKGIDATLEHYTKWFSDKYKELV